MSVIALGYFAFFFSIGLTLFFISYFTKKNIIDIPNVRSSHTRPTVRGGGVAIVISFALSTFLLSLFQPIGANAKILLAFLALALIGFFDDKYSLSVKLRLLLQVLIASLAILLIGIPEKLSFGFFELSHRWLVFAFSLFTTIWLTNLFNFMDGIDGIATVEAISVTIGLLLVATKLFHPVLIVFLAACLGFIVFNWHQARIFMGDVSSESIGFLFAMWAIYSNHLFNIDFMLVLILLSYFIFDATIVLLLRLYSRENVFAAHKLHFYQRAVQAGFNHAQVCKMVIGLNLYLLLAAYLYFIGMQTVGLILAASFNGFFLLFIEKKRSFKMALREHRKANVD